MGPDDVIAGLFGARLFYDGQQLSKQLRIGSMGPLKNHCLSGCNDCAGILENSERCLPIFFRSRRDRVAHHLDPVAGLKQIQTCLKHANMRFHAFYYYLRTTMLPCRLQKTDLLASTEVFFVKNGAPLLFLQKLPG